MTDIAVRASSWGSLFDCAYRWEGTQMLGMWAPSSPRAMIGRAVHAGTAVFDRAKIDGEPCTADDAAETVVRTLRDPEIAVDWNDPKLSMKHAEAISLTLHTKYCTQVAHTYTYASVEMETKPLTIDCGHGTHVTLTGTLDRSRVKVGHTSGGLSIADLKTGARAVSEGRAVTKNHRPQIGTYELLFEHTTGTPITEPGEVIGMSTSGSNEIATGEIRGAKTLMVGTGVEGDAPGLIEIAAGMFRTGLFPPNPQSILCSKTYCARWNKCPYHE